MDCCVHIVQWLFHNVPDSQIICSSSGSSAMCPEKRSGFPLPFATYRQLSCWPFGCPAWIRAHRRKLRIDKFRLFATLIALTIWCTCGCYRRRSGGWAARCRPPESLKTLASSVARTCGGGKGAFEPGTEPIFVFHRVIRWLAVLWLCGWATHSVHLTHRKNSIPSLYHFTEFNVCPPMWYVHVRLTRSFTSTTSGTDISVNWIPRTARDSDQTR